LSKNVIDELKDGLDVYWPNVKEPETSPEHVEFWQHEWSKHGTCSGLDQRTYFLSALRSSLSTPDIVQYGSTVDKSVLLEAYGGADKVVAVCSKGKFLSEVRSCLAVGEDGMPKEQIPCPMKALEENSCGDSIIIPKFPSKKGQIRGSALES
jgi:ribonuclease T2